MGIADGVGISSTDPLKQAIDIMFPVKNTQEDKDRLIMLTEIRTRERNPIMILRAFQKDYQSPFLGQIIREFCLTSRSLDRKGVLELSEILIASQAPEVAERGGRE